MVEKYFNLLHSCPDPLYRRKDYEYTPFFSRKKGLPTQNRIGRPLKSLFSEGEVRTQS